MGFNTWNRFQCNINETLVRDTADAIVVSGLVDLGYVYLNIDDCWQVSRDENGKIVEDPKTFPSGMKALADYVHSKGLLFGLYSDSGYFTCAGRPGSSSASKITRIRVQSEKETLGMHIVRQSLHSRGERLGILNDLSVLVSGHLPAVVNVKINVTQVYKTRDDNRIGSISHQRFIDVALKAVPRIETHLRLQTQSLQIKENNERIHYQCKVQWTGQARRANSTYENENTEKEDSGSFLSKTQCS